MGNGPARRCRLHTFKVQSGLGIANGQPVARTKRRLGHAKQGEILPVGAWERLMAIRADAFDGLLRVEADRAVGAAMDGLGHMVGVVVEAKKPNAGATRRNERHGR